MVENMMETDRWHAARPFSRSAAAHLPVLHCVQELFRISKENCDFKVTAGPPDNDKNSSGGDSGANSPATSSSGGAPPKKSGEYMTASRYNTVVGVRLSEEFKLDQDDVTLRFSVHRQWNPHQKKGGEISASPSKFWSSSHQEGADGTVMWLLLQWCHQFD